MRILHVCVGVAPNPQVGGLGTALMALHDAQLDAGNVVAIAISNQMSSGEYRYPDNVSILRCFIAARTSGTVGLVCPTFFGMRDLFNLTKSADIIHIHGYRSLLSVAAVLCGQTLRTPVFIQPHGSAQRIGHSVKRKALWDRTAGSVSLALATSVLALTEQEAIQIRAISTRAVVRRVRNAIPAHVKTNAQRSGCLFVGRLNWKKGVVPLVRSWNNEADLAGETLKIVGPDDGQRAQLETLASQARNISFAGSVPTNDVTALMCQSELLIVPSITDTSPMVILEALATETPVLARSTIESLQDDQELLAAVETFDRDDEIGERITAVLAKIRQGTSSRETRELPAAVSPQAVAQRVMAVYLNG